MLESDAHNMLGPDVGTEVSTVERVWTLLYFRDICHHKKSESVLVMQGVPVRHPCEEVRLSRSQILFCSDGLYARGHAMQRFLPA